MADYSLAKIVDGLLERPKTLYGTTDFQLADQGQGEFRLERQVLDDGEPAALLVIDYQPRGDDPKFDIGLIFHDRPIWRLDWADSPHTNIGPNVPQEVPQTVGSKHYHAWADNRHLVKGNKLPDKLSVARPLPEGIRGFEQAFKWFCSATNIGFTNTDIPLAPRKLI